jgi:quercetin dioxygenase-like cupin family protein
MEGVMNQVFGVSRFLGLGKFAVLLVLLVAALAVRTWATPASGFIVNQILATGRIPDGVSQHMQLVKNADGSATPWQLGLQVLGDTDVYSQHLVLQPGGYSGWHSHPGLLISVVQSGQIDFYDGNCKKRTVGSGEVYTENDDVHGIINTGAVDADLYISYLVKHGVPRRREAAAPSCAWETGIP